MTFVFDMDDTICATDEYSRKYISAFFASHDMPYKKITDVSRFAEGYFDWDTDTALTWYKTYGDQMMLEFPPKKGAIEAINAIHDMGHKVIIATARANDWHVEPEAITHKWLRNNNVHFDKIFIGRIDKEKICEEVNADVFVDDDEKIVERVAKHFNGQKGKMAYLMTTDYNRDNKTPKGAKRINSLSEIKELAQKDFKL